MTRAGLPVSLPPLLGRTQVRVCTRRLDGRLSPPVNCPGFDGHGTVLLWAASANAAMLIAALTSRSSIKPQCSHLNVLAPRDSLVFTARQLEHVLLVGAQRSMTMSLVADQAALYSRRLRILPGATSSTDLLRPALARTFLPGFSIVPRADRVMPATFRSSTPTTHQVLMSRFVRSWACQRWSKSEPFRGLKSEPR